MREKSGEGIEFYAPPNSSPADGISAGTEIVNDLEKKTVALSAENLAEVFPDAVRTDPDNRLGINYNAIITMLTEAVKQQQTEIQLLRKTLEENGLLEPEKP